MVGGRERDGGLTWVVVALGGEAEGRLCARGERVEGAAVSCVFFETCALVVVVLEARGGEACRFGRVRLVAVVLKKEKRRREGERERRFVLPLSLLAGERKPTTVFEYEKTIFGVFLPLARSTPPTHAHLDTTVRIRCTMRSTTEKVTPCETPDAAPRPRQGADRASSTTPPARRRNPKKKRDAGSSKMGQNLQLVARACIISPSFQKGKARDRIASMIRRRRKRPKKRGNEGDDDDDANCARPSTTFSIVDSFLLSPDLLHLCARGERLPSS